MTAAVAMVCLLYTAVVAALVASAVVGRKLASWEQGMVHELAWA